MDKLPAFGTSILGSLFPTFQTYSELHEDNRAIIESTKREEFQYGTEPRQNLDLYTPNETSDDTPIMVFLYGGGLARGEKRMPTPPSAPGLVYANIGHYWTSRGFITVIPDYRRTGEGARFPSGGDDIAAAISWIKSRFPTGSHKMYLMGNSAGAIHTATWSTEPRFAKSRESVSGNGSSLLLKGVILVSIPAHFRNAAEDRMETLTAYYGDRISQDCALGVLERLSEAPKMKTLVVTGTLDPEDEICQPSNDYVKAWKTKFGESGLTVHVLDGHNHFSTVLALGTGVEREESLGHAVLAWMS